MKKFLDILKNHIDFKVYKVTWFAVVIAILFIPCLIFLPERFGYENGVLENIQMLFLFASCFFAFKAKSNKKLFIFASMLVIILILREVNCGRTLFFAVPGEVNTYYKWSEIKYGWLAHPIFGIYIASTAIYFLWNKLFINLWKIFKTIRFPFWNILLLLTGVGLGLYAEKVMSNMVFEELAELLMYSALFSIIYLYSSHKNFQTEN